MEYSTIQQIAKKWNISERRVQILCRDGRIEGARKFGKAWAIPADANKPEDARVSTGEYRNWRKKNTEKTGLCVNFEFLGPHPIENIITCLNYVVDKVVFFTYEDMVSEESAGRIAEFLENSCGVQTIKFCLLDRYDFRAALTDMREAIEEELSEGNRIYFDITGGDSMMLVAFGKLSREYDTPMHVFDVMENRLVELDEGAVHAISEEETAQKIYLTCEEYIELQGGKVNQAMHKDYKGSMNESFQRDVEIILKVAFRHKDCWNHFTDFLRDHMPVTERTHVATFAATVGQILANNEKNKVESVGNLKAILNELAVPGVIKNFKCDGGKISYDYKSEDIMLCLFEGGSVLELYVYLKEKGFCDDAGVGLHLDWDGILHGAPGEDVLNEIDVLTITDNVPTFISCKTGKMTANQSLHALYELQSVADRFGGKYVKKKLVSLQPIGDIYLERAEEMGIEVQIYNGGK